MLPFSIEELERAVTEGHVTKRPHPDLPYFIYNYSPSVAFEKRWNAVTLNCRGLILDEDYNIVARPWKKFFNLGEVELPIQLTDPVEIMDKADGSLGILYPHIISNDEVFDIHWKVATRGSFASEQAKFATKVYREKYSNFDPLPGYTMLFEIIFPENRIVLDYGDMEDLILLGAVENETGYYIGPREAEFMWTERGPQRPARWPGEVVKVFPYNNISEALGFMERKNAEGYVIRSHNFLVKLKQPDYLDLHRLVTNASPRTVWEKLKDGMSTTEIISAFPDEFHKYISDMIVPLVSKFDERIDEILMEFAQIQEKVYEKYGLNASRAEYASVIKKSKEKKYMFLLLDKRRIADVLWVELKPTSEEVPSEPLHEATTATH
jgi:RNA ligase